MPRVLPVTRPVQAWSSIEVTEDYNTLMITLAFFGQIPWKEDFAKPFFKNKSNYSILAVVVFLFLLVHFWTVCFLTWQEDVFWKLFIDAMRVTVSTYGILLTYMKRRKIIQLMENILYLPLSKKIKSHHNNLMHVFMFCWGLYLLCRTVLDCFTVLSTHALQEFVKYRWYGYELKQFSNSVFILVLLEVMVCRILISGSTISLACLYCLLCHAIQMRYREFDGNIQRLIDRQLPVTSGFLYKQRLLFNQTCNLVQDMENLFSLFMFHLLAILVIGSCAEVTLFFTLRLQLHGMELASFGLDILYILTWFCFFILFSSKVSEESRISLPKLHLILHNFELEEEVYREFSMLFSQLISPRVELTGWNFFVMNRAFLLKGLGAILTYIIVVIQLNPKALVALQL